MNAKSVFTNQVLQLNHDKNGIGLGKDKIDYAHFKKSSRVKDYPAAKERKYKN